MNDAITIYHNPDCGTSRNTLALIRASGFEPEVIEYLKTPPDRDTLQSLLLRSGMSARDLLRVKGTIYQKLGLDAPGLTSDELAGHMLSNPVLINRPLVVTSLGVKLCRPSDLVLDLLPRRLTVAFMKEDGSPVIVDTAVPADDPGLRAALSAARLTTDDMSGPDRQFHAYATLDGECVGYGGFEHYGSDLVLRSIAVLPAARHRGIGASILALLQRRAFDRGARRAWLLTSQAADFFARAGFSRVERSLLPEAIRNAWQSKDISPVSATLLGRSISL